MDTTSWQPSQSLTSAQSVSVSDITTKKDLENPLHALESSDSVIFPLIWALGSEKHPLLSPESAVHHQISSETQTYNQSASEGVTTIGSKNQINVSHTVRATDSQTNQENVPLYMQSSPESPNVEKYLQGTIAPDIEEGMDEEEDKLETYFSVIEPEGLDVPYKINPAPQAVIHEESEGRDPTSRKENITTKPTTNSPMTPDFLTTPVTQKMSTTQEVLRVNLQESEPSRKPFERLVNLHSDDQEEEVEEEERNYRPLLVQTDGALSDFRATSGLQLRSNQTSAAGFLPERPWQCLCLVVSGVSAVDLLQSCCAAGQKWASDHQHCKNMPTNEKQSMCRKAVLPQLFEGDPVSIRHDFSQERRHLEGKGCEIHQFLGYPCGHIFLTCCEEEEGLSKVSLRRKPRPTSIPREDSEGTFPREAFAIGATDETANGVEEQKDVDECLLHAGKLCQQTCTNTWGSFHCGLIPAEENRVKDYRPANIPTITPATTTAIISSRTTTTTSRPVRINPCSVFSSCRSGSLLLFPWVQTEDRWKKILTNVLGTHNCGVGFVCENTLGSFLCNHKPKCITGFSQDSHGNCIDLCSSGFNCINTVGSFSCQQKTISCSPGYSASSDGAKCMGTNRCGLGQICQNLPGSYTCDCQTGYQYDSLRKLCTDINECDKKPCSQECANIYGSYQCYCRQGYHLKDDGHTCEDECSQSIGSLCTFRCVNVAGSYQCACPPQGFTLSANKRSCKDIDECTAGSHNCSYDQSCFNLQGGFSCNSLDCQNSPVRITYYQLSFQTNIIIPAQIFRIGPSPSYSGDHISISIIRGNEEGFFSTRKLNGYTGAVFLQRQVKQPKDFLIYVEMKLLRKGTLSTFLAKIYVFI
ncbi:hypothetical protein F7725_016425, partial [Dissostichus mawsoni]